LTMVERILGLKGAFEMEKPPWVTSTYWKQLVIPYLTLPKKKIQLQGSGHAPMIPNAFLLITV